jgi:hypothetical protein
VNAFHFDQGEISMSYHKKLTADHFDLNHGSKIRNHFSENVLDTYQEMLYCWQGLHVAALMS